MALIDPARWRPFTLEKSDFKERAWPGGGQGKSSFIDEEGRPILQIDGSPAKVEWTAAVSPSAVLPSGRPYRVDCEVRWIKPAAGGSAFLAQWVEPGGFAEGPRSFITVPADGRWHRVSLACLTPQVKAGQPVALRFLLLGQGATVQLRNFKLQEPK